MTKKPLTLSGIASILGVLCAFLAFDVWAQDPGCGKQVFGGAEDLIRGNMGTIVGLLVATYGLMLFVVSASKLGIVIIIVGVSITAMPGFYVEFLNGTSKIFERTSGNSFRFSLEDGNTSNCDQEIAPPPSL